MAKKVNVAAPAVQIIKPKPPEAAKPAAPKVVEGKPVKLVALQYAKDNVHLLHHVHSVAKGINHVPEEVWDEAQKHPTTQALLKSGDLAVVEAKAEEKSKAPKAKEESAG